MSYQEKRTIVSLISTILISAIYYIYVFQRYQEGNLNSTNDFSFWGAVIIILIPVLVIPKIIIFIIFSIINKIATNEDEPSFTDELDKLIDLKATRNFYHVFIAGFLLSMGSLVINMPPLVMFNILLFSLIVSGITLDLSQLYFYRRGI